MKAKMLRLSCDLLLDMFQGEHRYKVIEEAVPVDAKVRDVRFDGFSYVDVLIESEKFGDVEDGKLYPFLVPVMERLKIKA